jgi:hypothetical protein
MRGSGADIALLASSGGPRCRVGCRRRPSASVGGPGAGLGARAAPLAAGGGPGVGLGAGVALLAPDEPGAGLGAGVALLASVGGPGAGLGARAAPLAAGGGPGAGLGAGVALLASDEPGAWVGCWRRPSGVRGRTRCWVGCSCRPAGGRWWTRRWVGCSCRPAGAGRARCRGRVLTPPSRGRCRTPTRHWARLSPLARGDRRAVVVCDAPGRPPPYPRTAGVSTAWGPRRRRHGRRRHPAAWRATRTGSCPARRRRAGGGRARRHTHGSPDRR